MATSCRLAYSVSQLFERKGLDDEVLIIAVVDIEGQRTSARNQLAEGVASMATIKCSLPRCTHTVLASDFTAVVARSLSPSIAQWPPRSAEHTVSSSLKTLRNMNDYVCETTCAGGHTRKAVISQGTMLLLSLNVDEAVTGICLICAKVEVPMSACRHRDEMKKGKLRDPTVQSSR